MTTEEKAKAYDEVIEKGKQIQNTPYTAHWDIMKEVVEHLLPELREENPAWSEEDEFELENVLCHLRNYLHKDSYIRYENWLKSLKDRIQPKPKWKPSDKQLEYLLTIKTLSPSPLLESLYVDLKKLREE